MYRGLARSETSLRWAAEAMLLRPADQAGLAVHMDVVFAPPPAQAIALVAATMFSCLKTLQGSLREQAAEREMLHIYPTQSLDICMA